MKQLYKPLALLFSIFAILLVSCGSALPPTPHPTSTLSLLINNTSAFIKPGPGILLVNTENTTSNVMLLSIQVITGVSDQEYQFLLGTIRQIKKGEPVLIITGSVLNMNKDKPEIIMWAEGVNKNGQVVSRTLDAAYIVGQISYRLEYGKTQEFTIHLNPAPDLHLLHIYAGSYEKLY
jgi:hypothetical protein